MTLKEVQELSLDLIQRDRERNEIFERALAIQESVPNIPAGIRDKIDIIVQNTDSVDSLNAIRFILADLVVQYNIRPLSGGGENERLDLWEKALERIYELMELRASRSMTERMNDFSTLYGVLCGRVIYLPHEIRTRKAFNGDTKRLEYAQRFGDFTTQLYDPRGCHLQTSDFMPEGLLRRSVQTTDSVKAFWGKPAKKLDPHEFTYSTVYDYTTLDKRTVWVEQTYDNKFSTDGNGKDIVLMDGADTGMTFMPWFYNSTTMMLKTVIQSGKHDDATRNDTLLANRVVRLHYGPTLIEEGPNMDTVEIDHTDPEATVAKVPAGNTVRPNPEQTLDQGLLTLQSITRDAIAKSTMPANFQTGEFPSGTPVGSVNIISRGAERRAVAYRKLTEKTLSDIGRRVLLFIKEEGEIVTIDGVGEGERVDIDPDFIDEKYVYVDAKLIPGESSNVVERANAAQMQQAAGVSQQTVFKTMQISDPVTETERRRNEEIEEVIHQAKLAELQAQGEAAATVIVGQAQLAVEQQAMQAQQQAQAQAQQGFNPAAGGQSAIGAGGGQTFEQANAQTRNGEATL